jgi:hypothetical protein
MYNFGASLIPLWRPMYNVCGTWPLYFTVYVICHFWTQICNVLGYRRHHSICYTSLFTTPLVVTTISVYNVLWPSDVVSRSGPLISSAICSVISVQCLYLCLYLGVSSMSVSAVISFLSLFFLCLSLIFLCLSSHLSLLCLISCPLNRMFAPGIEDTFSHGCIFRCSSFAIIWLLRILLTVKNCWVAVE